MSKLICTMAFLSAIEEHRNRTSIIPLKPIKEVKVTKNGKRIVTYKYK